MAECRVIRGEWFRGMQGLDYFAAVSAESAGVPHQPLSATGKVAKALIARTDEQESVVLL